MPKIKIKFKKEKVYWFGGYRLTPDANMECILPHQLSTPSIVKSILSRFKNEIEVVDDITADAKVVDETELPQQPDTPAEETKEPEPEVETPVEETKEPEPEVETPVEETEESTKESEVPEQPETPAEETDEPEPEVETPAEETDEPEVETPAEEAKGEEPTE